MEEFETWKGVKQGDSLSHYCFIIFMNHILKQEKGRMGRIWIGYWNMWLVYIQALMFTDDTVVMANEGELQW